MKKLIVFLALLLLVFLSCSTRKEKVDLLITNATLVDVLSGSLQPGKLIAISADTIRIVADASMENEYEAMEIMDAGGKYVMPGLWDMHVHFRGGDSLINENKDLLPLFLAFGVTTVRDAGGDITPEVLRWRSQIRSGDMVGPAIFTSGPKLDGPNPAWPGSIKIETLEDVATALDSLELLGVDYVKTYDGNLSKEMYYEIIKEAEKRGYKVTGHMPLSASFMEAVDLGLDGAEHLYYTMKACSPLEDSLTNLNLGYAMLEPLMDSYDDDLADEVFSKMARRNVFITPTLFIAKTLAEILDKDHARDSLLTYIGNGIQQTYLLRIEGAKRAKAAGNNRMAKSVALSPKMIVAMSEAGVSILAGSDCGPYNSFVYPGESLHGELRLLVEAGLTPQQALNTSIVHGPRFFGLEDFYGSVDPGKVGDLIVLEGNPLEDIQNLSKITAVVARSKVYDREDLREMMEATQ